VAVDRVSTFLKERIAPSLRAEGFKGSGQKFQLPVPGWWALLEFQRARFGTVDDVLVTVNVLACSHETWEQARREQPAIGDRPIGYAMYPDRVWCSRIGSLMPAGTDHWWRVTPDTDLDGLADEMLDAITRYAIPAIRSHLP
jgi:hypothetical protein